MVILCDACGNMKRKVTPPATKPIDIELHEQNLSYRFNACKNMAELTYNFICVFGDELGGGLSTAEIYNFTEHFKKEWTMKGPRGGKSLRKTIYTVCVNGVKKKKLLKIKKNKHSYYDIVKDCSEIDT